MPGALAHSPADIVRKLLIVLELGSEQASGEPWPVFAAGEPDKPDSAITVYDTTGVKQGRIMQGETQERHGVQVRIRAANHTGGYGKARAIAVALDEDVYQETVTIGNARYLVHSISRTSDVLALGKESPNSKRSLFTVNGTVMVRQIG